MYGTVQQLEDGRWQLRFIRRLPHQQAKVWRAITEAGQLAKWFPTTIEGERRAGAMLRYAFPGGQEAPMRGEMLAYEPESLMELKWGPDVLRMELCQVDEGTELTLLHTFAQRGKAARDGAGWHVCLDALTAALRGDAESREQMAAWSDVHPHYVASFGPEAATIGPPGQAASLQPHEAGAPDSSRTRPIAPVGLCAPYGTPAFSRRRLWGGPRCVRTERPDA